MKLLRCFALSLCVLPLFLPVGGVEAAQPASQAPAVKGKVSHKPVANKSAKPAVKREPQAKSKARSAHKPISKAVRQPLPETKLDLSLPADMVKNLEPDVGKAPVRRKPLLPAMFSEKPQDDDSPFQLNGRLINNEMQLQLRNDSRRDVEGAAIDFEFRQ
ncbi:hypothetical protein [Pseudomonas sp. SWI44]|uniref:hypothetical protein n=1 Tax=Pseudomonas sp. SWI44 TaxID=2083053 RepID=UPI000CE5EA3B|nr:hypothetical protein [Pseudomonas sp. SWI44]AVD89403.1 hypothetical protein C4Q26_20630 [Pseudomonas sp. SWI44]